MSPSQAGVAETTGPVGIKSLPQASCTTGGVTTTISATHCTVSLVGAGALQTGRPMVALRARSRHDGRLVYVDGYRVHIIVCPSRAVRIGPGIGDVAFASRRSRNYRAGWD